MGFRREQGIIPGQPISARTISGFTQSINAFSRSRRNPPGFLSDKFWAKLSGGTSPYSFQEVTGDAVTPSGGISWVAVPGGLTGTHNAYEINATSGLSGKVALLEPHESFGSYVFDYPRDHKDANNNTNVCNGICGAFIGVSLFFQTNCFATVSLSGSIGGSIVVRLTTTGGDFRAGQLLCGFQVPCTGGTFTLSAILNPPCAALHLKPLNQFATLTFTIPKDYFGVHGGCFFSFTSDGFFGA